MSDFALKGEEEKKNQDNEADEGDGNDGNANPESEESTAVFAPVVHLVEVEVKTHEEDEDVLFKKRGKLFNYGESLLNKGTGTKTWNERGIGEIKILKHKETAHIRVLMRQEKTMKVIANHVLDPRIVIVPNAGATDRSWVWTAFDFSEGELVEKVFAIKFNDAESATEFKDKFKSGQTEMSALLSGDDTKAGEDDASKIADDLAKVVVKDVKEEEKTSA